MAIPVRYRQCNSLLLLVFLALNTVVCALEVDIYQHVGSGTSGVQVSSVEMSASSIGGIHDLPAPDWEPVVGNPTNPYSSVWVSSEFAQSLPGIVTVNGNEYSGLGENTWSVYHKWMKNYIDITFGDERQWSHTPYHDSMTVSCFFTPGTWFPSSNMFLDMIILSGTATQNGTEPQYNYAVLSLQNGASETTVTVSVHTEKGSGIRISLFSGHTYWVNLQYNGPAGKGKLAVFNPDNEWSQVGETSELELQALSNPVNSQVRSRVKLGRCDTHADYTSDSNPQTYFSHIMVDYTNAAFPLLPDNVQIKNSSNKNNTIIPQIKMYPNSSGRLSIQGITGRAMVEIFDLRGKRLFHKQLHSAETVVDLRGRQKMFGNGCFVIRLHTETKIITKRFALFE